MPEYKSMYFHLFSAITKALDAMEQKNYGQAESLLKQAQIDGEEAYILAGERKEN